MDQLENLFKNIGTSCPICARRLYIISTLSGVLFYILANTKTFESVEKLLKSVFIPIGIKFKPTGNNLVLFHSLVFVILMAFILHIVLDPVVKTIQVFLGNGEEEIEEAL